MSGRQDFGNFAGAFANAFSQGQQQRKDNEARDKYAKLQAQLIEMQLKEKATVAEAQQAVGDMMSPSTETFNPNSEFPSLENRMQVDVGGEQQFVPGPGGQMQTVPGMGLDEIIKSPEGIAALLASGQLESILGLSKESRLQGTADQQDLLLETVLGQLGDVSGGGGSGGTNPLSVEGMSVGDNGFDFQFGRNPEFMTGQQEELTAFNLGQFSNEATQAIDLSAAIQDSSIIGLGSSMAGGARDLQSNLAAIGEKVGLTSPAYTKALAEFDELGKLYATMEAQENAKWARDNPGGTPTDSVRRQIEKRVPTVDKRPAANFRLIANILERELEENMIKGTPMTQEQVTQTTNAIAKLRGAANSLGGVQTPAAAIEAIVKMNREQLDAFMANPEVLGAMTKEQLNAASKRLGELNAE